MKIVKIQSNGCMSCCSCFIIVQANNLVVNGIPIKNKIYVYVYIRVPLKNITTYSRKKNYYYQMFHSNFDEFPYVMTSITVVVDCYSYIMTCPKGVFLFSDILYNIIYYNMLYNIYLRVQLFVIIYSYSTSLAAVDALTT